MVKDKARKLKMESFLEKLLWYGTVGRWVPWKSVWVQAPRSGVQSQPGDLMILTIDSARSITLPKDFAPGDHVLLIPLPGRGYRLIPIVSATKEEFEQAMEDELEVNAEEVRQLAKTLRSH
jgi:hypothetical protein